ncbi:pyridoxamine 5'-phosphate oxidase family protein [Pseudochelatococcus contaminans]|uniref:General stress protein 26 n=1 Tax=Pseudochelatococcus contaminans TaxID=1538103 RepID=A0A7W5Z313_9HYPH|nr:pyridoxamine 5'-phosphate oxidase family protein [Pseudochelatococcus contaminans]MBB3808905.1 general stress protein 26 [Pseudochelatococcus contaminans]
MSDLKHKFWDRLDGINAGLLGTTNELKFVPMSHYADPEQNALWFITANGVDLVSQTESGPKNAIHLIGDEAGKLWARIEGQLELSQDTAKLDEIWNSVAESWFDGGKRDPDIRLLKFSLARAEVWTTNGKLGFLYEISKSKLTGDKPDLGENYNLTF